MEINNPLRYYRRGVYFANLRICKSLISQLYIINVIIDKVESLSLIIHHPLILEKSYDPSENENGVRGYR